MNMLAIPYAKRLHIPAAVRGSGYTVVRTLLALILLTAAALKGYQLATQPLANKDIFSYRWSMALQVEFEIFLGAALLSGLHKRLAWAVALLCFSCFSCITLYKALGGEASCGCFGTVSVNPWYTLCLDVSAVASLLLFRPLQAQPPVRRYWLRMAATALSVLVLGGVAGAAMASYEPAVIAEDGNLIGDSKYAVLEPETWAGKAFPLRTHIDVGQQLSKGTWAIMLYHYGCPRCGKAMPQYEAMAQQFQGRGKPFSIAMIEMPPYGPSVSHEKGDPVLYGQLNERKEWFVTTPAVVLVVDGVVKAGWEGEAPALDVLLEKLGQSH